MASLSYHLSRDTDDDVNTIGIQVRVIGRRRDCCCVCDFQRNRQRRCTRAHHVISLATERFSRSNKLSFLDLLRRISASMFIKIFFIQIQRIYVSTNLRFLTSVPRTNFRFGSRSFRVSAPTIWNSIPHSVRSCESLTTYRKHLKTLFSICIFCRPLATHYPAHHIQLLDFGAL